MHTTIAVYGDSYMAKLRNHCNSNLRVPATVYWFGKGGLRVDFKKRDGKIDTDAQAMYSRMIDLRPNVAFINVSGNDIIITRGDFSKSPDPNLDKPTFDKIRQKVNALLAKCYKDNFIRFPDIKYPKDYSSDGVHVSTHSESTNNTGMKTYESRIRRVLCSI